MQILLLLEPPPKYTQPCGITEKEQSIELEMEMEMEEKVFHVVIVPFAVHGHLLPAISLARRLATHPRFFVTFVLSQHRISGARSAVSHLSSLPSSFRLVAIPDSVPSHAFGYGVDEGVDSVVAEMERFRLMQQPFESLMDDLMTVDAFPGAPVCIISDPWLAWVQESADKLHIPRYAFYPSQATVLATLFYLPVLQAQGRLPLKASPAPDNVEECDEELVVRVPNLPPLRNLDCVSVLLETFPKHIRDPYVGAWLTIPKAAAGVLVNTFYELDTVPFYALQDPSLNPNKLPVFAIGPLHAHSNLAHPTSETAESSNFVNQEEKKCLQWLDSQSASSVLYISFGSLFLPSLAQIHELALGLEASEQFFVWVLRPPPGTLCPSEKFDVSTILPEGFLSSTKERGFIIPNWAPQRLILSHPSTGAFLTHCGWNSTLESICMGVPMVAVPQFADQRLNRMLIVNQLKVGVEPRRAADGLVERGEVERVTRLVLTGKEGMEMRSRAKQWSAAAMKAVEKGGSSDRNLESFISKMEQLSSKNL